MIRTKLAKLHISPIRQHSAFSVRIPSSVNNFQDMLPTISLSSLGSPIMKMKKSLKHLTHFFIAISKIMFIHLVKLYFSPLKKIIYDTNSSTRSKNIKRHETELKWIKCLQSHFPLGFNDNIYHEGNISKMPDFDVVFSLLECKKRKSRSHGKRKMATLSAKFVLKNA